MKMRNYYDNKLKIAQRWLTSNDISHVVLRISLLILIVVGSVSTARAETSRARAEYLYGPETSESRACELAIDKAKTKALASVMGESISADELLSCKGSTGKGSDYRCDLNQTTWTQIDGDIKRVVSAKTSSEKREGASACIAEIEVELVIPKGKPDPNFQLRADFKQSVFRSGDDLILDIELSQPGYFAVFNWLPHDNDAVVRIIPELEDPSESNVYLGADKNKALKKSYAMTASWSDAYSGKRKFYDEYLLVVATKQKFFWLSKYSLDEFKSLLQSIPITEKRLVKKAYQLTKN
jgi:hypothetical protein